MTWKKPWTRSPHNIRLRAVSDRYPTSPSAGGPWCRQRPASACSEQTSQLSPPATVLAKRRRQGKPL